MGYNNNNAGIHWIPRGYKGPSEIDAVDKYSELIEYSNSKGFSSRYYAHRELTDYYIHHKRSVSDHEGGRLLPIGSIVKHARFGIGTVEKILDGKILISFPEGVKTLALNICVSNRLLTIVN